MGGSATAPAREMFCYNRNNPFDEQIFGEKSFRALWPHFIHRGGEGDAAPLAGGLVPLAGVHLAEVHTGGGAPPRRVFLFVFCF